MKSRSISVLLMTLLVVLLAGCTTTPRTRAIAQNNNANYALGLVIDAERRVVEVGSDSAATRAGVHVGDQVVSLTWILSEAPAELPTSRANTDVETAATPLTTTVAPLRPPPGVEYRTAPFTAPDEIRTMISYGLPLRLQVVRQGVIRELTIVPLPQAEQSDLPVDASGTAF